MSQRTEQPVSLPRTLVNRLLGEAQRSPQAEVCGLVSSRGGRPERIHPVANVAKQPGKLFRMDPEGLVDAMRRIRQGGEQLFAIYHSHPHGPAAPSATDLREAEYPEALYLIVSLGTEGVLEMRGYRLEGGSAREVALEITP
ncbi:MAG TPA: M67 family peptidase [Gammaproteobacteria bacterium]|nr:M67 family peptidase [Gammaproteobacteria bacterium]